MKSVIVNHFSHFPVFPQAKNAQNGSALLIVLVMVVLLSVLVLAFLLNSAADRRLSDSSLNQTIADQLAYSAANVIVGDLKQEIMNPNYSTITAVGPNGATTISMPKLSSANIYSGMMPATNSATATIPNLVRISVCPDPIAAPGVGSRASAALSSAPSLNNRSISAKQWNAHYLIPLKNPGTMNVSNSLPDSTPAVAVNPNWVFVTGNGPQIITKPSSSVIGRYAYAIYDEGGLLDVNVAGMPTNSSSTPVSNGTLTSAQASNKSSLALIDLTNLLDGNGNQLISAAAENALVGWRNYASLQSNFKNAGAVDKIISGQFPGGFAFSSDNANDFFFNFGRGSSYAYLKTNYLSTGTNQLTDQNFLTRQQLISMQYALQQTVGFSPSALQYLTTYSRSLDQPSYAPNANRPKTKPYTGDPALVGTNTANNQDDIINPSFLAVQAAKPVTAGRNDGTDITTSEPLVKKRFALNRLAWITYLGPLSDGSNFGTATSAAQVNADVHLQTLAGYLHDNYGLSYAFLSKGTAGNIYKYFGLSWVTDTRTYGNSLYPTVSQSKWLYNHANLVGPLNTIPLSGGAINRLQDLANLPTPREPDFFELLKAGIVAGSKGRMATLQAGGTEVGGTPITAGSPDDFQGKLDSSLEFQIIQIGANIIEQSRLDGYTVQILYNDGNIAATKEFSGTENLPYVYGLRTGIAQGKAPTIIGALVPDASPPNNSYMTTPKILPVLKNSDPGYSVILEYPIVWNPHDQTSPRCATDANGIPLTDLPGSSGKPLFPTSFRIVADSIDPDEINSTGSSYGTIQFQLFNNYCTGTGPVAPTNAIQNIDVKTYFNANNTPLSPPFTQSSQVTNGPFKLTAESTALTFSIDDLNNSGTAPYFFREPTYLISPNVPADSLLKAGGSTNCLNPKIAPSAAYPPTKLFPSLQGYIDANTGALTTTENTNTGAKACLNFSPLLGFYLGTYPGACYWDNSVNGATPNTYKYTTVTAPPGSVSTVLSTIPNLPAVPDGVTVSSNAAKPATYPSPITYRMQYEMTPGSGNWITYDAKYAYSIGPPAIFLNNYNDSTCVSGTALSTRSYCVGYDPRSSRFSMPFQVMNGGGDPPPGMSSILNTPKSYSVSSGAATPGTAWSMTSPSSFGWLNTIASRVSGGSIVSNEIMTMRPDVALGYYSQWETTGNSSFDEQFPLANGWTLNNLVAADHTTFQGLFQINSSKYLPSSPYKTNITCEAKGSFPNIPDPTKSVAAGNAGVTLPITQYYADPDGVVRRAAGAYFTDGSSTISTTTTTGSYPGLPMATANNISAAGVNQAQSQAQSRPIILHRPFRSVAELGYVFSGTPWKNLDFFTPESGDCPLLDVFCIDDSDNPNGIVAGKVNLNTRQVSVLQTILTGAYKDEEANYQGNYAPGKANINALPTVTGPTSGTEANLIANLIYNRTSGTGGAGPAWGPLVNISDLVGQYVGPQGNYAGMVNAYGQPYDGFSSDLNSSTAFLGTTKTQSAQIQRFREAPIRALSAIGQTRVWNLLIDVIAQKGRFPSTAANLDNFYVDGQQRYWVHVAIDRFTGQVIDRQIEVVQE